MRRCFLFLLASPLLAAVLAAQDSPSTPASAPAVADLLRDASRAYHSGQFESAMESYQAALRQDSKSGEAYAGLTRVYLKQQNVALAFETANHGVEQAPNSPAAHTALGEVYFRQAKMGEAEREFLKAINVPQPDAKACLGLSTLYNVYSYHARARRMLDRAHELDPNDPEVLRRWMGTQKRSEQIRWLQSYLSGASNDDARQRQALQERLAFLQAREGQPNSACRLVTKLASTETPIMRLGDPRRFSGYGLDVKVNGHSTHLELDTGASGLVINKGFAEKAGIKAVSKIHVTGIGDEGSGEGFVGHADSIKIGDLEFQNCLVEVTDKLDKLYIDGLIGADVLSHYLVTIDFPHLKVRLEELPKRPGAAEEPVSLSTGQHEEERGEANHQESQPAKTQAADSGPQDAYIAPEMQSFTKIFRFGHNLLIPTRVGDTPPKLFLIDTGAMLNNISPEAAREVTKVHGSDLHVRGLSGEVNKVYEADKAVVQFSHFRQENLGLTTFDLSSISRSLGTEVSGILGLVTLARLTVKIDYRDGLVDFIYKAP